MALIVTYGLACFSLYALTAWLFRTELVEVLDACRSHAHGRANPLALGPGGSLSMKAAARDNASFKTTPDGREYSQSHSFCGQQQR